MEHKSYKYEIMNVLLKSRDHVRNIARKLGTNHMTVSRKMRELLNSNVVDYKQEGKNKIYFLKKNSEAKALVFSTENYKLIKILRKYPHLRKIIEKLQKNKQIKLAILFGSYAKDIAKKNSDIDVFVETENKKLKQNLQLIDSKLSIKIGKYNKSSLLIKEIEKNHVIIKGVERFYEKSRFFS